MVRGPIGWLPHFIRKLNEFKQSMERIQNYLTCPEINTDFVEQTLKPDGEFAIRIKNSNFSWGGKKEEKKEEGKEEEEKKEIEEKKLLGKEDDDDSKKADKKINKIMTLNSINLDIKRGEFICVIGEVGSGKSSLLSALLGDMVYVSDDTLKQMGEKDATQDNVKDLIEMGRGKGIV
jgi:ABC-type multidrug transport system fused ATPase/permease subunit